MDIIIELVIFVAVIVGILGLCAAHNKLFPDTRTEAQKAAAHRYWMTHAGGNNPGM